MRKAHILSIVVFMLTGISAKAEEASILKNGLEDRLYGCIEDSECPSSLKIQLLNELYTGMGSSIHDISSACAKKNYEDCVNPNLPEVKEWKRINDLMVELMAALESSNSLIAKENKPALNKK